MKAGGKPDSGAVVITDLTVRAAGRVVLDRVSLEFERGRTHVLVGPSGSGKTTLLRACNRLNELLDGYETTGSITIPWAGGVRPVYGDAGPADQLRRRVGMVFQNPNVLPVSIAGNFSIPLGEVLGSGPADIRRRMTRALEDVGLWSEVSHRLEEPATRLSGGQQQRLCLARALALEPTVLLLDEPTANLDFRATEGIEDLIGQLKEHYVLVVVSHSLDQAARIGDRIVVLREGQVVMDADRWWQEDPAPLRRRVAALFPAG